LFIFARKVIGNNHLCGSAVPDNIVLRKAAIIKSGDHLVVNEISDCEAIFSSTDGITGPNQVSRTCFENRSPRLWVKIESPILSALGIYASGEPMLCGTL